MCNSRFPISRQANMCSYTMMSTGECVLLRYQPDGLLLLPESWPDGGYSMTGPRLAAFLAAAVLCIKAKGTAVAEFPIPAPTPTPTMAPVIAKLLDNNGLTRVIPPRPAVTIYNGPNEPTNAMEKRALGDLGPSLSSVLHKLGEDLKDFASGQLPTSSPLI
jgi:hypothetical protein